jgi:hypothetical protein
MAAAAPPRPSHSIGRSTAWGRLRHRPSHHMQGLAPQRLARINDPDNESQRGAKLDGCFAYGSRC